MIIMGPNYPSKILLFGEYIIIRGGSALAVPLPHFSGSWQTEPDDQLAKSKQELLMQFGEHLVSNNTLTKKYFDYKAYKKSLASGMYFNSSIPTGYGLGSSGALCAAVYDRFYTEKILGETNTERQLLKQHFAWMESFFHGASSGIDPLVCYLQRGILIEKNSLSAIQVPSTKKYHLFLLDTGKSRSTGPLVQQFLTDCKDKTYANAIDQDLFEANENAIQAILSSNKKQLISAFYNISAFQAKHFEKMIPEFIKEAWGLGLQTHTFYLKLCGAGGGGFMLGLTPQKEECKKKLSKWNLVFI